MEDYIYYNELYDCYKKLLTEKQQKYFEDYYFLNLSLSEIAENYNVSRNAVHKQLQITIQKLKEYEKKLNLNKKREGLEEIINIVNQKDIKDMLEKLL